ncbi:MAG: hypothetical protein ACKO7N_00985 [Candidatus Nitrosotenuis sp.]
MSCDTNFLVGGPNAWFYFNQPISQIDGYIANAPQVLMHGEGTGLIWKTVGCCSVVKCVRFDESSNTLIMEQSELIVIHDNGSTYYCPDVTLPEPCCSSSSSSSAGEY